MDREGYMRLALALARRALDTGDVPVGCVVTDRDGTILGEGWNRREAHGDALAHAEVEAIRSACRRRGGWNLLCAPGPSSTPGWTGSISAPGMGKPGPAALSSTFLWRTSTTTPGFTAVSSRPNVPTCSRHFFRACGPVRRVQALIS